jgi:hypothetical protein
MNATDVVGYSFEADLYCLDCFGDPAACAPEGDTPSVVFADQVHDACLPDNGFPLGQCGDRCGQCLAELGFECPNSSCNA